MKFIFAMLAIFSGSAIQAQNLTGTWIGQGGGTDYIKLVVRQSGDSLMGYTFDIVDGYCYASFLGKFYKGQQRVLGRGGLLLEHSDNHVLTTYDWVLVKDKNNDYYLVENRPDAGEMMNKVLESIGISTDKQWLKRVSKVPELLKISSDSLKKAPSVKQGVKVLPQVKQSKVPPKKNPPVPPAPPSPKPLPSIPRSVPEEKSPLESKPVIKVPDYILREKQERESKLMRTIYTSADSIKIYLYDNGEIDGDTVTVFYDEEVVLDRFMISDKARILTLPVSRSKIHSIDLFANNLGAIPPNTALLVIVAGKARYELHASYDFKTNARILIQYKED